MPTPLFKRVLRALSALFFLLAATQVSFAISNGIVISQVYGAGGNSGSNLNEDYVELFNLGTTPVSINGWSLQYRSATGTGAFTPFALPNATIQPGQFFLVGASVAGTGTALPATDAQLTISLAGASGQIALSNSTVALTGCPTSDPTIVDFVGYGAAGCYEGSAPTAVLTVTSSASRTKPCTDTDNNGADFTVGADVPRNSATALQPCTGGGVAVFALTSAATSPTAVSIGSTTLLTARITPGATSTGISVAVDLSGVGGSSTQPLYDDGTHGDTTASDNVFNYLATIGGSSTGAKTLNFSAADAQAHTASGTASITIAATTAVIPIHTIQTGAPASTYLTQNVTTTGIVTAIGTGGFYLEARDSAQDADPATSEGIFVVATGGTSIVVGNELNVTGTVKLSSTASVTPYNIPATEIGGTVTMTVVSTGNTLPTPITLKTTDDSPTGTFQQFLRFQSMRVLVPSFTVVAPTDGSLAETSETVTSSGNFWGVVTGVPRPFAETGISVLEPSLPSGTPSTVPRFDGNPEAIYVASSFFGGTKLNVTSNQIITNFLGIIDYTSNGVVFAVDPTNPGTLGTAMAVVVAPKPAAKEFTIGTQNFERFYSNIAPGNGGLTLTAAAYANRLAKASLLIRNVLGSPDILGCQEMGLLSTLTDIANRVSTDAVAAGQTDPRYLPFLTQGNDGSGINTCFLVSQNRVTVVDVTQFGKSNTFTNSVGSQATLNDRPPLVLHAIVNVPGYTAYPVTVISNHLKALTGTDDTTSTGATVRLKKENQAEFLANLVQGYQAKGEHVVVLGDLNAYQFNDGYVDVLGVIRGNPVASSLVVTPPVSGLVTPNLVDLETTIADPAQQYDYTYIGNAQTLDHMLVTSEVAAAGAHLFYTHQDADFPLINYNDPTTPLNTSDHDGGVGYFPLVSNGQTFIATLTPATQDFGSVTDGLSATKSITFTNTGNAALAVSMVSVTGPFTQTNTCGSVAVGGTCTITVAFNPTTPGATTGNLTVASNATATPVLTTTLTGTGLAPVVTLAFSPATVTFPNTSAGVSSAALTATLTNSGTADATLPAAVVSAGDYKQTATTCTATLTAGKSCTYSVVFTPTALGTRSATLSVGSPAAIAGLSGIGTAQASISTPTAFATTLAGSSSTAQAITLTNLSGAALTFASGSITVGTNFTQTNTCGTTVAAAGTCTINVVFAPTVGGTISGALTVTPSIGGVSTTLTAGLSGTATLPPGFVLSPSSQTATQAAGLGISASMLLTPQGGYAGKVALSCKGAPAGAGCSIMPASVQLGANPVALTLNITTTKSAGLASVTGTPGILILLASLASAALLWFARKRNALLRAGLFAAFLLFAGSWTTGCATATANNSGSSPSGNTPAGVYPFTITATDGPLTSTATYTVTVQ